MNKVLKTVIEYGLIIALVILLRVFIVTPIEVNGSSMEDTLHDHDIMLLNKIGYNLNGLKRFDIVVIKYGDEYLIKRVIGLPGETIEYKNNTLYVSGKEVAEPFLSEVTEDYKLDDKIPNDMYFVMGDNRDNSADSRIIGLVDKKNILGKTNLVLFPFNAFGIVK